MTIKRKNKETGEEETTEVSLKSLLLGTPSFRTIIILLLLSMHPIGRSFLKGFGFDWQDSKKIDVAAAEAQSAKSELQHIGDSVKAIEKDVAALKANNAIVNEKVDNLKTEFSGFKIDFGKWKPQTPPQP